MYYEEKARDRLLRFLSNKEKINESDCYHLFKSQRDYQLIRNWLLHKEMIEYNLLKDEINISPYGQMFIEKQSFFTQRLKRDALITFGLLIGLATLLFTILTYLDQRQLKKSQKESQTILVKDTHCHQK